MGGRVLGEGRKISPDLWDRLSATVEERGTQWVNTTERFLYKIFLPVKLRHFLWIIYPTGQR